MKKTGMTILETIADKLGDEVTYKFLKELEELDDKREGYDYDSYMLAFLPFAEIQERLSGEFARGVGMEHGWALTDNQLSKIQFVYAQYDFVNAQAEELISKFEGRTCCHDKSSTLMRMYIRYLATGELPNVQKGEKEFWKTECGTAEEWMNFIDSTLYLHQGNPDAYLKAHGRLTESYEKWFEAKRECLDATLVAAPQFQEKGEEDDKVAYRFEDGDVTATVFLDSRLQVLYRYNEPGMEALNRKERYKWKQQEWFVELLNRLR